MDKTWDYNLIKEIIINGLYNNYTSHGIQSIQSGYKFSLEIKGVNLVKDPWCSIDNKFDKIIVDFAYRSPIFNNILPSNRYILVREYNTKLRSKTISTIID